MANHFLLFQRPLVMDTSEQELRVEGILPDYDPESAYVGELDVVNSVGRVTLEILESTLPTGATVRVDQVRKKVVVKWPKYERVPQIMTLVPNGGFEDGDDGQWEKEAGWAIGEFGAYNTLTGTHSARFLDVKTPGSGLRSALIPARVNDLIDFSVMIQQGGSSSGNAGGRAFLEWFDSDKKRLGEAGGNHVTSGKNGQWKKSSGTGAAPANTAYVQFVVSGFRRKQNRAVYFDDAQWNHQYDIGQSGDGVYHLHFRITDGLNRTAEWRGDVYERLTKYTSTLYPVSLEERVTSDFGMTEFVLRTAPNPELTERMGSSFGLSSFAIVQYEQPKPEVTERMSSVFAMPKFGITTYRRIDGTISEPMTSQFTMSAFNIHRHKDATVSRDRVASQFAITSMRIK